MRRPSLGVGVTRSDVALQAEAGGTKPTIDGRAKARSDCAWDSTKALKFRRLCYQRPPGSYEEHDKN